MHCAASSILKFDPFSIIRPTYNSVTKIARVIANTSKVASTNEYIQRKSSQTSILCLISSYDVIFVQNLRSSSGRIEIRCILIDGCTQFFVKQLLERWKILSSCYNTNNEKEAHRDQIL